MDNLVGIGRHSYEVMASVTTALSQGKLRTIQGLALYS